jgi:hypothetical protein
MEIAHRAIFLEEVYERMHIYHSIILYRPEDKAIVSQLCKLLRDKDFPVYPLTEVDKTLLLDEIEYVEGYFRIIPLSIKSFASYCMAKNNDLTNITAIFCTDSNVVANICKFLDSKNTIVDDSLHIFSF